MTEKGFKINTNLVEQYLTYQREQERSHATLQKYKHDLYALIKFLGEKDLTKAALIDWKEYLIGQYATASVNAMLAAVNGYLRYMGWSELAVKPLKIQRSLFLEEEKELTREEYVRLVKAAQAKDNERLSLVIQTICATGIRTEIYYCTYIEKVQTSSHHLLSLINDVLDMSKIESSQVTLTTEPVNFAEQIGQVESIVRPQAEEKGQNFIIRIHNITHEYLIGDAVRLRQIFLNLLSNAVKYTSSGGDISLELEELSAESSSIARFRIRVIDTGCGMAITKNIIDLMGGTISIQSEVDKGSCFTVELPLSINTNVGKELLVKNVLLIGNIRAALREMDATRAIRRS